MLLGVIADDFTGATDIANTLAKEGMRTRLFIGSASVTGDCDAGVVALKSRSLPAGEAISLSLESLSQLQRAGCGQFVFKYCSTFDSTPAGNIGPVGAALADALGARGVVVCPAFPANGRTVYQGHLFVHDRLLSESGMASHPLTPMTDPDLRRWLGLQGGHSVAHVPLATVRQAGDALSDALAGIKETFVVVDAIDDSDLRAIGRAAAAHPLLTGGSGIALGLPDNFRDAGLLGPCASGFVPQPGPGLILSGSCSTATREQIAACLATGRPAFAVDVGALMRGAPVGEAARRFIDQHRAAEPLVYSSADPAEVTAVQVRHGAEAIATAVEELFGALACHAVAQGYRRLVAAGGETSGAVVTALGIGAIDIGPEIAPGVPAVSHQGDPALALALKSGNFGGPDFMVEALRMLGGGHA